MYKSKVCIIFMVLLLTQAALGKPTESVDSSAENGLTSKQELTAYIGLSLIKLIHSYNEKYIKVSREILKDEEFLNRHEPIIVEFKHNLTRFVDAYDSTTDMEKKFDLVDLFSNTTDLYYEISEDKFTPESKYIVEVLDKHHYKDIEIEMDKELSPFVERFMKIFEERRSILDKSTLEWYEKFQRFCGNNDGISGIDF